VCFRQSGTLFDVKGTLAPFLVFFTKTKNKVNRRDVTGGPREKSEWKDPERFEEIGGGPIQIILSGIQLDSHKLGPQRGTIKGGKGIWLARTAKDKKCESSWLIPWVTIK